MKRTALIKHLRRHHCLQIREGGRHSWWSNPASGSRSAVPRHSEIPDQLARKICRDLRVPEIGKW
ncbi:MAG TPA: type II toxin-antitoxin system HicA family toxin [Spirochaetia bacterium]|nr:type II toxin-antitoxin system HicA family toxin [Spirochaetia bacterium]